MHFSTTLDRAGRPIVDPAAAASSLVVASIPADHVYVRHLAPEAGGGPRRLPDPDPAWPGHSGVRRWWPPAMLQPAWVRAHDVDVAHLHFGFDDQTPEQLTAWVAALRESGTALVVTVHDLRNPHHRERSAHDAALDVLVPAADALVTLTPGAAAEIAARWGREARVVPHPHVVDLATMAALDASAGDESSPRSGPFRIGLHVKSLRANADPLRLLPILVETVADLPDAVLAVNAHHDVIDAGGARHDPELAAYLRRVADRGDLELVVHDYLADADLWAYLSALDVSVLPHRFGTHSGWLEACRDLGTTVIAPTCGYFAEQGPVLSFAADEDHFDAAELANAVRRAHAAPPQRAVGVDERRRQRAQVATAHDEVYAAAVARLGRGAA